MRSSQNTISVRCVCYLEPVLTIVRKAHFVIGPSTRVRSVTSIGYVDSELMSVDVGDAKMEPLRVTFLVGTFSERLFTNLAIDRSTRQVSGRDIR